MSILSRLVAEENDAINSELKAAPRTWLLSIFAIAGLTLALTPQAT